MIRELFVLAAAAAFLPANAAAAEPSYRFELDKRDDAVVADKDKERTVFTVTGKSGIGGAVITLADGKWPERVTLRFRYDKDKGFGNLEEFRLRTDRVLVEGSLKSSGKMRFCFLSADGKPEAIEKGGATPAGLLDVTAVERDGAVEVTLPANLLTGSGKVKVSWIDAYRR
jgi:hypothetical protein